MKNLIAFLALAAGCCLLSCDGVGPCAGKNMFWEMGLYFRLYDKKTDKNLLGILETKWFSGFY